MTEAYYWIDTSDKAIWKDHLSRLPSEYSDVYFEPDYCSLYENKSSKINCFIYTSRRQVFLYPFLMQEIAQAPGYYDISTPYGYGGHVYNSSDSDFLKHALCKFYEEAKKRNVIAELIKFHPLLGNHKAVESIFPGKIDCMCSTVYVDLDIDEENRWKNMYTHANRKCINKAIRSNTKIEFTQHSLHWESFKRLYELTLMNNNAAAFYCFSESYYQKIKTSLTKNYVLASAMLENKIVATLLLLLGTHFTHCHLIGSDRNYMSAGINNLLHHEVILWSKQNGYSKLHIGGGRTNDEDDSLLKFKKSFSNEKSLLYVGEYILDQLKYDQVIDNWLSGYPKNKDTTRLLRYRA